VNHAPITYIRVVMDDNYPPYAFTNENGEMQGILVDQWKLWAEQTGVEVGLVGLHWDQALDGMKKGKFDVIDTIFYTQERAQFLDYTKPYANIDVRIFFPSNVSGIGNVESLQRFPVAVKRGDANAEYLIEHGVSNLSYYDSYEEIIAAVAHNKEAIFVIDQPPALYFLYKYDIQNQFAYSEPLYGGQFHRAVKKGNTEMLALVNEGFEKISAAKYLEIDNRWFGVNSYADITDLMPYLIVGLITAALVITALFIFNRELRARVAARTQELEKAIGELKNSETRFREAVEFLPIPLGLADKRGEIIEYNRKFTETYGYTKDDTPNVSEWMQKAYPNPEYRKKVFLQWEEDVKQALKEQKSTPAREYKVMGKDGREHDTEITMHAVEDLWVTAFVEITEHKRAEAALRAAETKYRVLIEHAPEVIYRDNVDESNSNAYISAQIEALLGFAPADFAQNPKLWHELVHPQDYQRALSGIKRTLLHGGAVEEYRMTKHDGSTIWARDTSVAIHDESGQITFIQGFLQDITERKKVEEKLLESEKRYRTLFDESPIALLEEDFSELKAYIDHLRNNDIEDLSAYFRDNPQEAKQLADMVQVINVNKAAVNWYKVKNKSNLQTRLSQLIGASGQEYFFKEILTLLEDGIHYEFAASREGLEGAPIHIIINGTVIPGYESTWERVLISILDVTKRKQAEEDLARQIERLRALRAIDHSIINNMDMDSNLNVLLDEIVKQLNVDAAAISLLNDQTLQFAAGKGLKTNGLKFMSLNIGEGLAGRVARERDNVYIRNLQEADYHSSLARAFQEEGFIAYCGAPLISKDNLLGVLEIFHRSPFTNDPDWLSFLETLAGQAAISIDSVNLFVNLKSSNAELQLAYDTTLEGWSRALDLRDRETEGHTRRVTELTEKLARKFDFTKEYLIQIKRGCLLHDIGKMGIPDAILLKPGTLSAEEWEIMRKHPMYAYEMLAPIKYLQPALEIPYCHHERWDGSGYPRGLKGQDIPLAARIFAVVDVWDALTSNRPYRAAWDKEKVKEYLREGSGKQFDPRIVNTFLKMLKTEKA
jgi:PAS domain S-box-containing protein